MDFEIVGQINDVEIIAIKNKIRDVSRLVGCYGKGRWRKLKGIATIRLSNRNIVKAELHWYEADGVGKKEIKIKRYVG